MRARNPTKQKIRGLTVDLLVAIRQAALGRRHRQSVMQATGIDVPATERWILHAIPGQALVPIGQVASSVEASLPVVSRACTRLADAGHLIRLTDPRDRRRTLVGLSDQTEHVLRRWSEQWPSAYLQAVDGWPDGDIALLDRWFHLVVARLSPTPVFPLSNAPGKADDRAVSQLGHFESTVRVLVPAAGRLNLIGSCGSKYAQYLTERTFQLLLIAKDCNGIAQSAMATLADTDPALTRRRVKALLDLGYVELRRSPAQPGHIVEITDDGKAAAENILHSFAQTLPEVPPEALADSTLASLLTRFSVSLRRG